MADQRVDRPVTMNWTVSISVDRSFRRSGTDSDESGSGYVAGESAIDPSAIAQSLSAESSCVLQ